MLYNIPAVSNILKLLFFMGAYIGGDRKSPSPKEILNGQNIDKLQDDFQKLAYDLNQTILDLFGDDLATAETKYDDRFKELKDIVLENGFAFEEHKVTTDDNLELTLHRIPPRDGQTKAPVVLFQHGIEDCSTQWVVNSADKAAAFVFARAGFDVWLGNNRGNHYSRFGKTDAAFWNKVDFELMGTHDLPAFIDYILEETKNHNVIGKLAAYVGHSQGTTQFFIGSSMKPDYFQDKVNLFVALAPIVRLDHTTNGGFQFASQINGLISWLVQEIGLYDLIDLPWGIKYIIMNFCEVSPHLCLYFEEGFFDYERKIENIDRLPVHYMHQPAGAGWKQLVHYAQIIESKRFQRFDYGSKENQKVYNQSQAPEYNLGDIKVPILVAQGSLDMLANQDDVAWLLNNSTLDPSLIVDHKMFPFGHNTFFMGQDASFLDDFVIPAIHKQFPHEITEQKI